MKVVTIIQARTSSSRLPRKVIMDVYGTSLLERVIDQSARIRNSDELWVATSDDESDDMIEIMCERLGVSCYRGSLEDVRSRFFAIATDQKADIVVRVTADNPLTDPEIAEELVDHIKSCGECDFVRMKKGTIVDGSHSEVFSYRALKQSVDQFRDKQNREHVTPAMIQSMKMDEIVPSKDALRVENDYFAGIDTYDDLKKVTRIYQKFGEKETLKRLIKHLNKHGNAV